MALIIPSRTIKTLRCFIMIGQSPMEGGDNTGVIPSTYLGVKRNVLIAHNANNNLNTNNFSIQNLEFGVNQNWRNSQLTYCGPELSFAKDWADATGEDVLMIKYALGGCAMVDDGTEYANGHMQWNATHNPAPTGDPTSGRNHYEILRDLFIIPTILSLRKAGIELIFSGEILEQGETDMQSAYRSANWRSVNVARHNKLIEDILPYNSTIANMKSVIMQTGGPNFTNVVNRPYYSTVRQAQVDAVADLGGYLFNKDSLSPGVDGIHETRATQCIKGSMLATELLSVLL